MSRGTARRTPTVPALLLTARTMFEKLRRAFREAVDNFHEELNRDQVPEAVDALLRGMRSELTDSKVRLKQLEEQIRTALREAEAEKKEAATARRRGKLAADIGDEETARVAGEYAARHGERAKLLERKALALKEELDFRQGEHEEMMAKVKEAEAKRASLAATTGRADARETLGAADDLFAELDRMAEKIGDEDARARAAEELGDVELGGDRPAPESPPPVDVDARLAELKRRMDRGR